MKIRYIVFGTLLLAAGGVGLWGFVFRTDVLEETLRAYDFVPIKLPSDDYRVGSIVHVNGNGRIRRTICEAPSDLVSKYGRVSNAEKKAIDAFAASEFAFGGKFIDAVNAALSGDTVQTVALRFDRVSVFHVPDDVGLKAIRDVLLENEVCKASVTELLERREYVCQSSALLQATVRYEVAYDRDVASTATVSEAKILETVENTANDSKISQVGEQMVEGQLEAEARGSDNLVTKETTEGVQLNYGMKVHPTCLTLDNGRARILPDNDFDRLVAWLSDKFEWAFG